MKDKFKLQHLMKRYLYILLLIFVANNSYAVTALNTFQIQSNYLNSGKLNVPNSSIGTAFKSNIGLSRSMLSNGTFEPVEWTISVVYSTSPSGGVNEKELASVKLTGSNFDRGFYEGVIDATLPANTTTGYILIKSVFYIFDSNGVKTSTTATTEYSKVNYGIIVTGTGGGTTPPPPPPPPTELYPGEWASFPSWYVHTDFNFLREGDVFNGPNTFIRMSDNPILTVNQSIYSPDKMVRLTLQGDGNLVIYHKNADGTETALWSSNTPGKPAAAVYFQRDANLVIYNSSQQSLWGSNRYRFGSGFQNVGTSPNYPFYCLQNDGNLVCYWPSRIQGGSVGTHVKVFVVLAASDTYQFKRTSHEGSLISTISDNRDSGWGSRYEPGTLK